MSKVVIQGFDIWGIHKRGYNNSGSIISWRVANYGYDIEGYSVRRYLYDNGIEEDYTISLNDRFSGYYHIYKEIKDGFEIYYGL